MRWSKSWNAPEKVRNEFWLSWTHQAGQAGHRAWLAETWVSVVQVRASTGAGLGAWGQVDKTRGARACSSWCHVCIELVLPGVPSWAPKRLPRQPGWAPRCLTRRLGSFAGLIFFKRFGIFSGHLYWPHVGPTLGGLILNSVPHRRWCGHQISYDKNSLKNYYYYYYHK